MSHIYDAGIEQALARLDSPDRYKHHDPEVLFAKVGLKKGETLADLGCGTGFFALPAARIVGDTGLVLAVDIVPEALAALKKKMNVSCVTNIKTISANATATGIEDGTMDTVLMANVFHDVDKQAIVAELRRILKPNGRIVVLDWKKVGPKLPGPPVESRITSEEVSSIFEKAGWKVTNRFDISTSHYVVVAVA